MSRVVHQEGSDRLPPAYRPLLPPAQHHQQGEGRRPERLRGVDRLRPRLRHVADPGRQEPDERGGVDGQGELRGQHKIQESQHR